MPKQNNTQPNLNNENYVKNEFLSFFNNYMANANNLTKEAKTNDKKSPKKDENYNNLLDISEIQKMSENVLNQASSAMESNSSLFTSVKDISKNVLETTSKLSKTKNAELKQNILKSSLSMASRIGNGLALAMWPGELGDGSRTKEIIAELEKEKSKNLSFKKGKDIEFSKHFVEEATGAKFSSPPEPEDEDIFDKIINCKEFGKVSKIKNTRLWATIDNKARKNKSHGGVYWKIYEQSGKKLIHKYETDDLFRVINKHKGPKGRKIDVKKKCIGVPGWKGF